MSFTGAGYLANQFRALLDDVKADLAVASQEMAHAVSELKATADEAFEHVKTVRKETAELKAAFGLHSNGPPVDASPEPVIPIPAQVASIFHAAGSDDTGSVKTFKLANGATGQS